MSLVDISYGQQKLSSLRQRQAELEKRLNTCPEAPKDDQWLQIYHRSQKQIETLQQLYAEVIKERPKPSATRDAYLLQLNNTIQQEQRNQTRVLFNLAWSLVPKSEIESQLEELRKEEYKIMRAVVENTFKVVSGRSKAYS